MNTKFVRLVAVLLVMAVGYSVLSTPGNRFMIDIGKLKTILLYVLLGGGGYAIYTIFRQYRPPGV